MLCFATKKLVKKKSNFIWEQNFFSIGEEKGGHNMGRKHAIHSKCYRMQMCIFHIQNTIKSGQNVKSY